MRWPNVYAIYIGISHAADIIMYDWSHFFRFKKKNCANERYCFSPISVRFFFLQIWMLILIPIAELLHIVSFIGIIYWIAKIQHCNDSLHKTTSAFYQHNSIRCLMLERQRMAHDIQIKKIRMLGCRQIDCIFSI